MCRVYGGWNHLCKDHTTSLQPVPRRNRLPPQMKITLTCDISGRCEKSDHDPSQVQIPSTSYPFGGNGGCIRFCMCALKPLHLMDGLPLRSRSLYDALYV
jgi:hypothetical protein